MSDQHDGLFSRADEVLHLFKRGADFTRELLKENERLRRRVVEMEDQHLAASDDEQWAKLRQELTSRIQNLEGDRADLLERLTSIEQENRQFAERYLEIEEENNNLASLYVASYQLHSTLDLGEVFQIIVEIVINLIGAEIFAIYVVDEKTNRIRAVASEGAAVDTFPEYGMGQGMVGSVVSSGETACTEATTSNDPHQPIVCIPLRVQERPIGAIAIQKLLQQKQEFTALDYELFTLLAGHAATAIFAARLYGHSERKLNTIQGFIDLLTQ